MKTDHRTVAVALMAAASTTLGGCEAVRGIFRAGVWAGALAVLVVVLIVMGAFALLRGR